MGSVENRDDDDRCQHPGGCMKSFFTFCPHCRLFICISHLNQHHDAAKTDVRRAIIEAEQQRSILEQQIINVQKQKTIVNRLYEQEIEALTDMCKFVAKTSTDLSINSSCYTLTFDYRTTLEQLQSLNQKLDKRSFLQSFMPKIDQLLQENDQQTENYHTSDISETSRSVQSEVENDNNSMIDFVLLSNNEDSSSNHVSEARASTTTTTTFQFSNTNCKLTYSTCPLARTDAFGLLPKHDIPCIPCNYRSENDSFTFGECVDHLTFYHRIRPKVARFIVQTIVTNENSNIDPTKIDLFSAQTTTDIVSKAVSLFVDICPLTEDNVYGLQSHHNIALCSPRPSLYLYQHLRLFHNLKAECARRIIYSLMNKEPPTQILFESSEKVKDFPSNRSKQR